MGSKRIDQVLLLVGALLTMFSGFQLFLGSNLGDVDNALAELISTRSVVKTKSARSLDWRDAGNGNLLGNNQLIYTDADSSAEVSFLSGDRLSIASRALVRITQRNNANGLDVKQGSIRTTLTSGEPLAIGFNGKEYVLEGKGANVQISLGGETGEIGVLGGAVKVTAGDKSINLNDQTALEISDDGVAEKKISYRLQTPQHLDEMFTIEGRKSVSFTWEPLEEVELLLSSDPGFQKVKTFTAQSGQSLEVEEGVWFWKVKGSSGQSLTNSFKVIKEVAPVILRPQDGEEIKILAPKEGTSKVLLQWKGLPINYEVEWKQNQSEKRVSSFTQLAIDVSSQPDLAWRVRIKDPNRPDALWSDWQRVTLNHIPWPEIPNDLFPHEVEFQSFKQEGTNIEFNWKSQQPVDIEVLGPKDFRLTEEVQVNYFSKVFTVPGEYSWRIRAFDQEGRRGDWSEFKRFNLEDLSDQKTSEGIVRIQLKKPEQEVTFDWDSPEGSTDVFELSSDANFEKVIIRRELNTKSTKLTVPRAGTYFWRSRQFLPDGKFTVSEPVRVLIEPTPAPSKPQKAPDMEVPIEYEEASPKTSWLDWIIPTAHADELKGVVRLKLPPSDDAKSYVVRIFRDSELQDLIFEEKTSTTELQWLSAQPGTYFWQYAIVDFWDRMSPFSDASQLLVRDMPKVTQPKLLFPIRAQEVNDDSIVLKWTSSGKDVTYSIEVATDPEFKTVIFSGITKTTSLPVEKSETPGLHYWRVLAQKEKTTILSNTGRFTSLNSTPPPTQKPEQKKTKSFLSRVMASWVPSLDSFEFKQESENGKIDGQVLNGVELRGVYFFSKWALGADILRQSGKVFESQDYLFQRVRLSLARNFDLTERFRLTAGLSVGQVSGQSYEIINSEVKAKSTSGLIYGPTINGFFQLSERYELLGQASYLVGEIPHFDGLVEILRHFEKFFLSAGGGLSKRSYDFNSGEQTSMRISFGAGREF